MYVNLPMPTHTGHEPGRCRTGEVYVRFEAKTGPSAYNVFVFRGGSYYCGKGFTAIVNAGV
jgi:hypothetical protein